MSELSDFFADTAVPQLLDGLGDDVPHWPRGREANAETIRAIIDASNQTSEGAEIQVARNSKIFAYLMVSVLKTVVITVDEKGTDTSQITYDGKQWFAQKMLGEDPGDGGLRHFQFMRTVPIATAQAGGR